MAGYKATQGAGAPQYRNYAAQKPTGLFARRGVAAVVLALTVLLGSVYGCHRSLNQLKPEMHGSRIEHLLNMRADVGFNLVMVAEKYGESKEIKNVAEAASVLRGSRDDEALIQANRRLTDAAEALLAQLETLEISEQDAGYLAGFRANLSGMEDQIARDPYNDRAERFNATLRGTFPANVLGPLTGVTPAPLF